MWVNFNTPDGKPLSMIEMMTLVSFNSYKFEDATLIIDYMDQKMAEHWEPTRGTIYPILKRLESRNLIERDSSNKLKFQRTNYGDSMISSMADNLVNHLRSTFLYLEILIANIMEIDSYTIKQVLDRFIEEINTFQNHVSELKTEAEKRDNDEGWTDITVK